MLFPNRNTERLFLRRICPLDRYFVLSEFSDPDVNQYLYDAEPVATLQEADELINFYTNQTEEKWNRWVIIRKEDNAKLGTIGLHCWQRKAGIVEVGYDMQKPYWGKGYAFEALQETIRFVREAMPVSEIRACIALTNQRSINLALRCGFRDSGETKTYHFHGADYPHAYYSLKLDEESIESK